MEIPETLLVIGPNRHGERPLIEQQFVLTREEAAAFDASEPGLAAALQQRLRTLDGFPADFRFDPWQLDAGHDTSAEYRFAERFVRVALAVQQATGHRVSAHDTREDAAGCGVWGWFEYEHDEVGMQASRLAQLLFRELLPVLQVPTGDESLPDALEPAWNQFRPFSRRRTIPRDSQAIFDAALRLDVPCVKLERDPYTAAEGGFRVRPNGLLMLGHCAHRRVVDGVLCIDRNPVLLPLVRDRDAMRNRLVKAGLPVPRRDPSTHNCAMTKRALRAAQRVGYPVVARPAKRHGGAGTITDLADEAALRDAIESLRKGSSEIRVEAQVAGATHHLLLAGGELAAVLRGDERLDTAAVCPELAAGVERFARELDAGLLQVDVVTEDIGRPLEVTGGAVADADIAPRLDHLPGSRPDELLQMLAERFVRWLFPAGEPARIPIVAITGTNGKTTTTRMVGRILQEHGLHTGTVCSDGILIDGTFSQGRGKIGPGAHHHLFERPEPECAVFEEYFGRIARLGFAYAWCDVAVCTNVTADHLGRIGVHTLEQLAELKAAVLRRARHAVVLNADDERCLAMQDTTRAASTCLVSMTRPAEDLLRMTDRACVLERIDGEDWIVLHAGGERLPVVSVRRIPAAFDGSARHNVANAMQAACATHALGVAPATIGRTLESFAMSFETTPGRLNIYDGLPFRVILDYAHNLDGFLHIGAFVDSLTVEGRKIVMAGQTGDRRDADIRIAAAELARHFDRFVCRNYTGTRGRSPEEVPALMRDALLAEGIAEEDILCEPDATRAIECTLGLARPGDLVVLLTGDNEFTTTWARIEGWGQDRPPRS